MYKAIILPLAQQDIKEAAHWYKEQQKGLGKRFTAAIRKKIKLIRQHPQATGVRYKQVRTAVLETFPYMIHYSIEEAKKRVVVVAVLHTSRNPEQWKDR